jgi:hypothetical protein
VEPLPQVDDDDPVWGDEATWDRVELLMAMADAIGDRRLVEGIALISLSAPPSATYTR